MGNILSPEKDFPIPEDIAGVCDHVFQRALSMHADGEEQLIRVVAHMETIGLLGQDNRPILISRDRIDVEVPSDHTYEVEVLKRAHEAVEDDFEANVHQRVFVIRDNPYEFFEKNEVDDLQPIGRAPSLVMAEHIIRANMMRLGSV